MRYTFLLYSNPADFAHMTEADFEKEKEVYGAYIGALQEAGVLEAVYGAFALDWLAPGEDLGKEALYLASLLSKLLPEETEVLGLTALIALNHARTDARLSDQEAFVPLDQQDTDKWDHALIRQGLHLLSKAQRLHQIGRFQIEAAIQSVHIHRDDTGVTDWVSIVKLYSVLLQLYPTMGSAVAHAAAVGEAYGAEKGLIQLDRIEAKRIDAFQPAIVTRAHLLSASDPEQAVMLYQRAIELTTEAPLRRFLLKTKDALADSSAPTA